VKEIWGDGEDIIVGGFSTLFVGDGGGDVDILSATNPNVIVEIKNTTRKTILYLCLLNIVLDLLGWGRSVREFSLLALYEHLFGV